ncbi:MAG: nucleotidyltransferase family protein [Planctomycetes bacterium]|nr:nucleotidyltransferase family protein [Planctomycetota bacterium]
MIDILAEFEAIVTRLAERGIDYAVCGGFAVNIHGHVRATRDIDLLVQRSDLPRLREILDGLGFSLEAGLIPFASGTAEEREHFRVSKVKGTELLTVDLLLVTPVFEDVWRTREAYQWNGKLVPTVSRKGLARMKRLAGRHQDLADLENLEIRDDE